MNMKSAMANALWALVALLVAVGCAQDSPHNPASPAMPAQPEMPISTPTATVPLVPTPVSVAVPTAQPPSTPAATFPHSHCAKPSKSFNVCDQRDISALDLRSAGSRSGAASGSGSTPTVEDTLELGLGEAGVSPVHLVIRGTASSNSTRCGWRGIARTSDQREDAIRLWLRLADDKPLPNVATLTALFSATLDVLAPAYEETAQSNFSAIAKGGLSTEYLFLTCFADYTVREYILGAGPTTITLAYDRRGESRSYELYRREHADGTFGKDTLMTEAEYQAALDKIVWDAESALANAVEDKESVVFLAPMGAHNAIAVEAWQVVAQWDARTASDGTVNAVRYGASPYDPEHTQTLAKLKRRVTKATTPTAATTPTPVRITNVSGLTKYYRDIGAYDDITPGDGSTDTFTPAKPPPVPTCAGADATPNHRLKPGLARDCSILLDSVDALEGTASLDWSSSTAIANWEGVALDSSAARVATLDLDSEGLNGIIPPA